MLRLFLKEKIGEAKSKKLRSPSNRRAYERFPVDHKHLTMMNEQDILVLKDISAKGFSSQVSPRTMDRLNLGDIFSARIRYHGEMYDLEAKVSWKSKDSVGFELVYAEPNALKFMQRLIQPISLAHSLKLVETSYTKNQDNGRLWFHGDDDTDLYVWNDTNGSMCAWQLISKELFLDWHNMRGLNSGIIKIKQDTESDPTILSSDSLRPVLDKNLNSDTVQFAVDLINATALDVRDEILETIVKVAS